MSKKFLRKTSNWAISIIVLILLAAVGCGIWFFVNKIPAKPPVEFLAARERGAKISQKIAELSSATAEKITEINSLDLSNDYSKASSLIEDAKNENQEALNQAVKLGNEVQKMAEFLNKIPSSKSQELAMKAIATETSLLTNFMQYTLTLDRFLGYLNLAFATSKAEYRQAAENNLSDLNLKTNTINNLNRQFTDQMREFDESFSR